MGTVDKLFENSVPKNVDRLVQKVATTKSELRVEFFTLKNEQKQELKGILHEITAPTTTTILNI